MKRALFAIIGTVVGLVALLSFKTHTIRLPAMAAPRPVRTSTGAPANPARSGAPPRPGTGRRHAASPSAELRRRYIGPAVETPYGIVQVAVKVADGRITGVMLPRLTAFNSTSQMINSQAAPILVHETLAAQSARIDTVSGATYTSEGYLRSLQAALNQAGL